MNRRNASKMRARAARSIADYNAEVRREGIESLIAKQEAIKSPSFGAESVYRDSIAPKKYHKAPRGYDSRHYQDKEKRAIAENALEVQGFRAEIRNGGSGELADSVAAFVRLALASS